MYRNVTASNFKTTDSTKMLDARFAKDFKELDRKEDQRFDQYVARKLRAWFTMFPPTSPGVGCNDNHEEGAGGADGEDDADGDEEDSEVMALSARVVNENCLAKVASHSGQQGGRQAGRQSACGPEGVI